MVSKPLSWLLNGNRNAVICSWLFMNQDGCSRIRRSLSRNSSDKLRKWRCRISKHGQNLWCFNIHNKRALALANALLYFEENQMSSEIYLSAACQQKLELSIKASFSTFFLTLIFTSPADLSLKKKPLTYKWIMRIFVSPCPYQSVCHCSVFCPFVGLWQKLTSLLSLKFPVTDRFLILLYLRWLFACFCHKKASYGPNGPDGQNGLFSVTVKSKVVHQVHMVHSKFFGVFDNRCNSCLF